MGVVEAGVRKPATSSATAPIRVLVVDDSHVIRGLLTRTLDSDPGIKVVASASNGKAAIEEVSKNEIDVVVLDIEMPVMDGMTALPQLIAARPGLQVIMASTLTLKGASISMKAISRGAVDYVPKPTSTGEINSAEGFKRDLISKVKNWGAAGRRRKPGSAPTTPIQPGSALKRLYSTGPIKLRDMPTLFRPDCLAIGWQKKIAQAGILKCWDLGDFKLWDVPVVLDPNGRKDADGLLPIGLFSRVYVDPNGLITLEL